MPVFKVSILPHPLKFFICGLVVPAVFLLLIFALTGLIGFCVFATLIMAMIFSGEEFLGVILIRVSDGSILVIFRKQLTYILKQHSSAMKLILVIHGFL